MTNPVVAVVRQKWCQSCGRMFGCCAGGCWCDDVPLTDAVRAELCERYEDCLCPTCLRNVVSTPESDRSRSGPIVPVRS